MIIVHKGLNFLNDRSLSLNSYLNIVNAFTYKDVVFSEHINIFLVFNNPKDSDANVYYENYLTKEKLQFKTSQTPWGYGIFFDQQILQSLGFQFVRPIFLHFSCTKFDEEIDWEYFFSMPHEVINIPAYGWYDDQWFDGETFYKNFDGNICAFASKGYTLAMCLNLDGVECGLTKEDFLEFYAQNKYDFVIESLVNALRNYSVVKNLQDLSDKTLIFKIERFSLEYAIALVCLKKAYPDSEIFLHMPNVSYVQYPSSWKRLIQNLGIGMVEKQLPADENSVCLNVQNIVNLINLDIAYNLKKSINKRSDIIPANLK